ncbi:MAG: DUF3450 domain-containing protein [Desulfovermiculus sp.]
MKYTCAVQLSIGILAALLLGPVPGVLGQAEDAPLRQALQEEQEVQEDVQTWSKEKRALVQEILSLQTEKKWLELQNEQHEAYIRQTHEAIERLEEQKDVARSLRMELEPYLVQVSERLQQEVENDLPFLPQEREDRVEFIEQSLTEYGLELSERLRRVLEALTVEAKYGTSVQVTDREVEVQETPTMVQTVRIGRVGLFYVTPDGNSAGMWDAQDKTWKPLAREAAAELHKAVDIIQGRRAAELVRLPVGTPEDGGAQ